MQFNLRIPPHELRHYLQRYDTAIDPDVGHIRPLAEAKGHITRAQLHELVMWKSPRRSALVKANAEDFVQEITGFAFSARFEASRIGALTLLQGVRFPTASVILHFCVDQTYPILDYRAIWSLGLAQPSEYSTGFWAGYVGICRTLAQQHQVSVRELDMALWQYSREHQPPPWAGHPAPPPST